jgi:hypothetical protein
MTPCPPSVLARIRAGRRADSVVIALSLPREPTRSGDLRRNELRFTKSIGIVKIRPNLQNLENLQGSKFLSFPPSAVCVILKVVKDRILAEMKDSPGLMEMEIAEAKLELRDSAGKVASTF